MKRFDFGVLSVVGHERDKEVRFAPECRHPAGWSISDQKQP